MSEIEELVAFQESIDRIRDRLGVINDNLYCDLEEGCNIYGFLSKPNKQHIKHNINEAEYKLSRVGTLLQTTIDVKRAMKDNEK